MDAKGLLQFQLGGSFKLLLEVAQDATDGEWVSRAHPGDNVLGFTVWHGIRTIDWAVNCVMRGRPELADHADWQDLKVQHAAFGAGASRDLADSVATEVLRSRVASYIAAVRDDSAAWLADLPNDDLNMPTDLRARHAARPEYMEPAVWEEIKDLDGIPGWQFLARPCVSHIRVHYGEVKSQLEAMRAAAPA